MPKLEWLGDGYKKYLDILTVGGASKEENDQFISYAVDYVKALEEQIELLLKLCNAQYEELVDCGLYVAELKGIIE